MKWSFSKKEKKTKEELDNERAARVSATADNLKVQILTMERKQDELLAKVVEARQKGLKNQEEQARGLLRKCMAQHKQASGMLMTLELAIQSRDLASLNQQFLECITTLSRDTQTSVKKSNAKQAEKQYLKATYASQKQSEELDKMLEIGDYAAVASMGGDKFSEFDAEIDALVGQAELNSGYVSGRKIQN